MMLSPVSAFWFFLEVGKQVQGLENERGQSFENIYKLL